MAKSAEFFFGWVDTFLSWLNTSLGQSVSSYVDIETAESRYNLVARDGSLVSIIKLHGSTRLVGPEEYESILDKLYSGFKSGLSMGGHGLQCYFQYDESQADALLNNIISPSVKTAQRLELELDDLFKERVNFLSQYCHEEQCYIVVWTSPSVLAQEQLKTSLAEKMNDLKSNTSPRMEYAQNMLASIPQLRDAHGAFVKNLLAELSTGGLHVEALDVYEALKQMRISIDRPVTSSSWKPHLPGDKLPMNMPEDKDLSNIFYPPLSHQLFPRDAEIKDLHTLRIGDKIYSTASIDVFPQEPKSFNDLFVRLKATRLPWRISWSLQGDGLKNLGIKPTLAAILSFAGTYNRLISDSAELLKQIDVNSDEAIVQLRFSICTWTDYDKPKRLKGQIAELIKAIQSWGFCEISEYSGDSFYSFASNALAVTNKSPATATICPLFEACSMLPFTRPTSTWSTGALMFRSPDGKPMPYQPGSPQQTTWIDLIYARPGSGKSVLSNSLNLALCLQSGLVRLPRIGIVDIGPSSSGLISLLKEALPPYKKHLVAYHRLRMIPEYSINPFDTQLGSRKPTPQERSFLVNFLCLLCTPVGHSKPYDGIPDMCGMIVDELYKLRHDKSDFIPYQKGVCSQVDEAVDKISNFTLDDQTSWWEVTDALFEADFIQESYIAQRYAVPLLSDSVTVARSNSVGDLYGGMLSPTGETLVAAFTRMISSAIREYPILSRVTAFDLGEARVVSLDLDEVAKSGGDAADRQTAIMYMLARFIMAKDYYLSHENISDFPEAYKFYHSQRIREIREDQKRLVLDEFHRTSKAQAVRDQVVVDMREGRKWRVQVAVLSQSLDDFDSVMVEFATSIFILDAGPKTAVEKSVQTFGLTDTDRMALTSRVHGPRAGGATMLAQFATKHGTYTQLCTSTLGPIELWAFNTTSEDAYIRNALYDRISPKHARQLLARVYPSGSAASAVVERLEKMKGKESTSSIINDPEEEKGSVLDKMVAELLDYYHQNRRDYL